MEEVLVVVAVVYIGDAGMARVEAAATRCWFTLSLSPLLPPSRWVAVLRRNIFDVGAYD